MDVALLVALLPVWAGPVVLTGVGVQLELVVRGSPRGGWLAGRPALYVEETPGRAGGGLAYVHVACTEYLTVLHVGDRSGATIDAGGVLPAFTGTLVRDGYAHLPAVHAWCAAHLSATSARHDRITCSSSPAMRVTTSAAGLARPLGHVSAADSVDAFSGTSGRVGPIRRTR